MNNLTPLVKRVCAYMVDILIVMILSLAITSIPFLRKNTKEYQDKYSEYEEKYTKTNEFYQLLQTSYQDNEISQEEYDELLKKEIYLDILTEQYEDNKISKGEYKEITNKINEDTTNLTKDYNYILGKIAISDSIITIITTLLYFGVIQYILKGQTVGKKLLNLQVVSASKKELNIINYILRSLIINNVLLNAIGLIFLAYSSKKIYLQADSTLSLLVSIVEAITIFLVMTREDKRGLHDLLFNTKVISLEKEPNKEIKNNKPVKEEKKEKNKKLVLEAEYKEEVIDNGETRNKQKRRKK